MCSSGLAGFGFAAFAIRRNYNAHPRFASKWAIKTKLIPFALKTMLLFHSVKTEHTIDGRIRAVKEQIKCFIFLR
jgi:hypothetical protein